MSARPAPSWEPFRVAGTVAPRLRAVSRSARALGAAAALTGALALFAGGSAAPAAPAMRGVDVVLCLDVSRSMLARDLAPTRLARAQREIRALAARAPADRFSLVLFAGEARLAVPPTHDGALLSELAGAAGPESLPRGGSDLGAALEAAAKALGDTPAGAEVLLLTDGEDLAGRGAEAARVLAEAGARVHALGCGDARGSKIAVVGPDGRERFLRDPAGREVVSRLDEASLSAVVAAGGGVFLEAGATEGALVRWYEREVEPASLRLAAGAPAPAGGLPRLLLGGAALLWLLAIALGEGRRP